MQSYEANHLVEVTCFMSPDVPVYAPAERIGSELALLVEGLPMPVWVTGPETPIPRGQRRMYAEFVDAIAYWLWQFASAISPVLQAIRRQHAVLRVIVELNWEGDDLDNAGILEEAAEPLVVAAPDRERGVIVVRFGKTIEDALATADNVGERLFVREILLAIRGMTNQDVARTLRDHALANTIDRFAPLGLKKKVFFLSAGNIPQLDSRGLPHARPVQEVDKNLLLDPIGDHFRHDQHFADGPHRSCQCSFCHQRDRFVLLSAVHGDGGSLSPEGLLECDCFATRGRT